MTSLLEKAFSAASKLSEQEQNLLASRLLAELAAENAFDQAIADSGTKLSKPAKDAIEEHRRGRTKPLDPDAL